MTDLGADLRTWLAAQGLGLTAGTNLFRGQFPQDVVEGVLVLQTGGDRSSPTTGGVVATVQITSRYRRLDAAMAMANTLHALVDSPPGPRMMGASKVLYSKAMQPPFSLSGQDERQAWRVIFNAEFILAR